MQSKRIIFGLIIGMMLLFSLSSALAAPAQASAPQFQWPFPQGESWIVIGGFSDGTGKDGRTKSSPHYYKNGGALDIAPYVGVRIGADTSNMVVVAAAPGKVIKKSACFVMISHDGGITSAYYHLDKVRVNLNDQVKANDKLGIIANNYAQATCSGGDWKGPHVHFEVRGLPNGMNGLTVSGWVISYVPDKTTFTKNGVTKHIFEPLDNPKPVVPLTTTIVSKNSQKCVSVTSSAGGANAIQVSCNNNPGQVWRAMKTGSYYLVVNANSGRCLDVKGEYKGNGGEVIQWDCNGNANQQWSVQQVGDWYVLKARHSNLCLDVLSASKNDGVKLIQYTCNGGSNQSWKLTLP
jgi:murein DD-endopeptidase MepM/ murein hydrolase activator NlpD